MLIDSPAASGAYLTPHTHTHGKYIIWICAKLKILNPAPLKKKKKVLLTLLWHDVSLCMSRETFTLSENTKTERTVVI